MDINAILNELKTERAQLEGAILSLQRLQLNAPKRRGRPPKWMTATTTDRTDEAPKRRGRPPKNDSQAA